MLPAHEWTDIIGKCPNPPSRMFDFESRGHPFSWHERKPVEWYRQLIKETVASLVIDLTPASGAMAQYIGVCRHQQHASWLQNILNRAAVVSMTREGSALDQAELAKCIHEHFKELIKEMHDMDAAKSDSDYDEDEEEVN